jgi:choline kinase
MQNGQGRNRRAAVSRQQPPHKAIILSAGQARRLLPLTETAPKCLLPIDDERTVLELQLEALAECGLQQAILMLGFGAEQVEALLATRPRPIDGLDIQIRYNPFFESSNNLATCWLAAPEMNEDFVLLNGDTLFEAEVLHRLLRAPHAPVTLAIDRKAAYDDDDMKVSLNGGRQLAAVSKTLPVSETDGESIGMMVFRDAGVDAFQTALNRTMRSKAALQLWYLSVIDSMAQSGLVETASIEGLWWAEVDTLDDLIHARTSFAERQIELSQAPEFSILEET